ncbi:hypothetical protein N7522_005223 [Penicillium canescens]|nr:hypothetical protein N7522_005223 [Penicillium canescens]
MYKQGSTSAIQTDCLMPSILTKYTLRASKMRRKPEAQASHAQPEPPPCQTTKTIDLLTRASNPLETSL